MGVSSSPSSFNRLVRAVISDLQSCYQTYFDDLFGFTCSNSIDGHTSAQEKVLTRCAELERHVKIEKCKFLHNENSLSPLANPALKYEPQSILGTYVYVMKLLCNGFSDLIAPLIELNKVLAHPNRDKPFHVAVDVSSFAIG
ncbi:RxLR effector protein [Phytophthora megakarya]|uniref:RxLR effector protein n=1 Tax=Phytophthora megakarya TaxID=4795 RepID=A0A225WPR4_9STRA|nr:RxLR effector protein [Phytophthora megakarya]